MRDITEAVCGPEQRGQQTGRYLTDSDLWGAGSWGKTFRLDSPEAIKKGRRNFIKMDDHEKSKSANIVTLM